MTRPMNIKSLFCSVVLFLTLTLMKSAVADSELGQSIVPIEQGLTFTQTKTRHGLASLLVLRFEAGRIIAVNVSEKLEEYNVDPLALVSKYGIQRFREFGGSDTISVDVSLLELPPNMSNEQLGVGASMAWICIL